MSKWGNWGHIKVFQTETTELEPSQNIFWDPDSL